MTAEAKANVTLARPNEAFRAFCSHLEEHGIPAEPSAGSGVVFRYDGFEVHIAERADSLGFVVQAPSANILYFVKEAVVQHLSEIEPDAALALRWSDGGAAARPPNFQLATVESCEPVHDMMIRLRLQVDDCAALGTDGLHIKLMVPTDADREPVWPAVAENGTTDWPHGPDRLHVRYYTIRSFDLARKTVTIDVVRHYGGRIAEWVSSAGKGATLGLMGPGGGGIPKTGGRMFLAGDYTALPAIARILEALPADAEGTVLVTARQPGSGRRYLPETSLSVCEVEDAGLHAEASRIVGEEADIQYAWFGGEFTEAQAMRKMFKQVLGLDKDHQLSVAYWRRGKETDASLGDHDD
ncbi:MAG: siderophore-interacting protein [Pseudomonadota bacterium]